MVSATENTRQTSQTDEHPRTWFTAFLLFQEIGGKTPRLRCVGCKELIRPDYKKPTHISGAIEFDGTYIPVIDPGIVLLGRPTKFNNLSCILIVPHLWDYQKLHTGVFIENIDEIMAFSSSIQDPDPSNDISVNIKFILDMRKNPGAQSWLYENHRVLDSCRSENKQEQDYIAFKRMCSEKILST